MDASHSQEHISSIEAVGGGALRVELGTSLVGEVTQVGGVVLDRKLTSADALALLASNPLSQVCVRQTQSTVRAEGEEENEEANEHREWFRLCYRRLPDGPLGVTVQPCTSLPSVLCGRGALQVISSKCSALSAGEIILAVNDVQLLQSSPTVSAAFLESATDRVVTLIARREPAFNTAPSADPTTVEEFHSPSYGDAAETSLGSWKALRKKLLKKAWLERRPR